MAIKAEDVTMSVLNRFRRTGIWSVEVGDVIRFQAVYQSRTGFLVRLQGKGRVETLQRRTTTDGEEPTFIEGMLRDRHGIRQRFELTEDQQVYRLRRVPKRPRSGDDVTLVADQSPPAANNRAATREP